MKNKLKVALAQIAPVWLDKKQTTTKVLDWIAKAANEECNLVCFGETLLPGYPFWVEKTNGALFNSTLQKDFYAHYRNNAITIENGDLTEIQTLCKQLEISCYLGVLEAPKDRGQSVYASLVYINTKGEIKSVHRKLMPTYDERLVWATGDGNGLKTHEQNGFTLSGLNCWENWMPLARTALYAQGTNVHVAVWPGSDHNTKDITRFIARESRSYVLSVSSLMGAEFVPDKIPHAELLLGGDEKLWANGGSCIAGPDGEWIIQPQIGKEELLTTTLDFDFIRRERHNFDPVGHYSRPDVLNISLNTERQTTIKNS